MFTQTISRRQLLQLGAAGAVGLGAAARWGAAPALGAKAATSTIVYDDFADGGASYFSKWFTFPGGEPEADSSRSFAGGVLHVEANPFTAGASEDDVSDHLKYLAVSTNVFTVPTRGSLSVAADIHALTPGTTPGHVIPTTGRVLLEGQQAAATLHLLDFGTGQLFDWFVSEHKAFALYERLMLTVGLDKGFTQITGAPNNVRADKPLGGKTAASQEFSISPGPHRYEMRYSRGNAGSGVDKVEWLIDGEVRARVNRVGVPLDVQNPGYYRNGNVITYPSLGPGEELKNQITGFSIAHGIFSLVDEFPFSPLLSPFTSIPVSERVFGQGCIATYDNFTVTTETFS